MKSLRLPRLLGLLAALVAASSAGLAADVRKITPAEAAQLVAAGKAVLVDIREPREWQASGVAAPAVLLPTSDFNGPQTQWKDFLATTGDKQVLLYCGSGGRANTVGNALAAQGIDVANVGGFRDWTKAGLPVRKFEPKK